MSSKDNNRTQQDSNWAYPFSHDEVKSWKQQYGENNVHLVETDKGDYYVIRGLYRKEFLDLHTNKFRNEEDMEDQFVMSSLLYPSITHVQLREQQAALSNRLYEKLLEVSNIKANESLDTIELTDNNVPDSVNIDDYTAWRARYKNSKLYLTKLESKPFIYRGLKRSEYERFRNIQRDENKDQPQSENEICSIGVVYPIPKDFNPVSNDYLYGTISSLSLMVLKVSGFGTVTTVTKL